MVAPGVHIQCGMAAKLDGMCGVGTRGNKDRTAAQTCRVSESLLEGFGPIGSTAGSVFELVNINKTGIHNGDLLIIYWYKHYKLNDIVLSR